MAAFFVAQVTVKDGQKFQAYAAQAKVIFAEYGGQALARGKAKGTVVGEASHHAIAVIQFPDMESLESAFDSDDYQAIVPLRDESADISIVKYEQSV